MIVADFIVMVAKELELKVLSKLGGGFYLLVRTLHTTNENNMCDSIHLHYCVSTKR